MIQELTANRAAGVSLRAYLMLAGGILCLSFGVFFVKWAEVPGPASAFYRLLTASLVLVPLWLVRRPTGISRRVILIALAAGGFFALDVALWNTATLMTSAANAALFGSGAPIWVALGSLLLFRERLPALFWPGMLLALSGAALIIGVEQLLELRISRGDALAVVAGIFYAAYLLATQRVRAQLDTFSVLTLAVIAGVVVVFVICLVTGTPLSGYTAFAWGNLIALGLLSQVVGALAISYALGHIHATTASVAMLAQPVLVALMAVPLLGESLAVSQALGGSLVLGGIYLVNRR